MGKIMQFQITQTDLVQAIMLECQKMTPQQLQTLSASIFGVKLNICGSRNGPLYTTNLDRVQNDTLLKFSKVVDLDSRVLSVIRGVQSDTSLTEVQAKVKASMALAEIGIVLDRKLFEQAFLANNVGGASDV